MSRFKVGVDPLWKPWVTSLPTTANKREHRNQDAFCRNGTRTGFSLTADWERSAGNEFSVADLESACK